MTVYGRLPLTSILPPTRDIEDEKTKEWGDKLNTFLEDYMRRTALKVNKITTDIEAGAVLKTLFDANTMLAATVDNDPAALSIAASRIVGRKSSGNISAMTGTETRTILGLAESDSVTFQNVHISSGETYDTILEADNSELSADHTLTLGLSNADRIFNITGDCEISQDFTPTADPTLGGLTVTTTGTSRIIIEDSGADAGGGNLYLRTNRGGGASNDNDYCGFIGFQFDDSGGNQTTGADIYAQVIDNTDTTEDADLVTREMIDGSLTEVFRFTAGNASMSGNLTLNDLIIGDGRYIGSASDTDAIQIDATGNVVLTQVLTVTGALYVNNYLYHLNDTDTGIIFGADSFYFLAGNLQFLKINESDKQDELVINDNGVDIDTRIEGDNNPNLLLCNAGNDNITINAAAISANYDLALAGDGVLCLKETSTPTADANYGKVYCKNDNLPYFQDGAGTEHPLGPVPKKLYVSCEPILGTGTYTANGVTITNGEFARFHFFVDDYIDASQDIVMTFMLVSDEQDATEDMKIYVETRTTDNEEASEWNIEDGTAFTFDSENANQLSKYQYTLAAANYENNDGIFVAILNNTGTATIQVLGCTFEMVAKDS